MNRLQAMARHFLPLVAALTFSLALPASGAETRKAEITGTDQEVAIELGSGSLLQLPRPAASVFVSNPEIADVQVQSPKMIYVYGKTAGRTGLYAIDERGNVMTSANVTVTHNLSRLEGELRQLLPATRVRVASVGNSIVLEGDVSNVAEAEDARRLAQHFVGEGEIINRLAVQGASQVNLRVRFAEVSRTISKNFGFNWEALGNVGNFTFGFAQGSDINVTNGAVTRTGNGSNIVGFANVGNFSINSIVDALEQDGLITILAEPNLTALSGETASFLAGGEFPIPVSQDDNTTVIVFKEFGVSLEFTPTLIGDSRISLVVAPEVSQLSAAGSVQANGFSIPALTTRRARTTVELSSGQSFAIAGLLQNGSNHDLSKTPWVADIPVLGTLFRSDSFIRNETELIIIVTPYLVRPVNQRLALPTDGFVPPTDVDRVLLGSQRRLEGEGATRAVPTPPRRADTTGFILE
ncbi:type II and III secretion system protein family protein [Oceanibacterium hippocampi]|uniref:Putative type II secretion system protein D n=1 Tax=Oceanibacterium hippocampi TaxID=745714 RepID=A0A1Y5SDC5_9PROT|nr:type II and III secretion system protein family protein [Oceanibacterium hippocampi]SLN36582.1 Putative type II secretion system protein D precursor [Oceanibacterium hippocampi]